MLYLWFRYLIQKQRINMRRLIYILTLALLACAVSCEERNPALFDDISGICFDNRSGLMAVTDSLDFTFVYEATDLLEVPVKVQIIGRASDVDRPVDIRVSSSDAVEGVDYILPENPVIPAGEYSIDYLVRLKRTPALKQGKKMISLSLLANEHFALPVSNIVQVADTVSVLDLRIYFSDMFTQAPSAWDSNLLGEFTQQKFELICKVLGINPADFNDASVITLAKQLYISVEMTAYVEAERQKKLKGEEYDENAFDYKTGEPLTFRK